MNRTSDIGSMALQGKARFSGLLRRRRLGEDGVSAVEFGLFAPILFLGLLATVDLGLAIYERMTIDHVLRAGAQAAMNDPGADQVLKVLEATATKNFTMAGGEAEPDGAETLSLDVLRYCACPEATEVAVACSTTCAGSEPTFIYYHLSGTKTYDGMIIPRIGFGPTVQVQVR